MGEACILHASHFYLRLDLEGSRLDPDFRDKVLKWAVSTLSDAGSLDSRVEGRVYGRFNKWVKRAGRIDVAIAYLAFARDFILVTGDLVQFEFFKSLHTHRNPKASPPAIYISMRSLA